MPPQYYLFNQDIQYKDILAWHTAYKLQNHSVLEHHLEDGIEKVIHIYITRHRNSSDDFNMNNRQPVIASEFILAWHQPQTAHVVKCKCAAVNLKWLHKHYYQ